MRHDKLGLARRKTCVAMASWQSGGSGGSSVTGTTGCTSITGLRDGADVDRGSFGACVDETGVVVLCVGRLTYSQCLQCNVQKLC